MSSIESAPAHIAATSVITFAAGLAPALLRLSSMRSRSPTRAGSPTFSARRTTGTSPASAIRFGSSNATETAETA